MLRIAGQGASGVSAGRPGCFCLPCAARHGIAPGQSKGTRIVDKTELAKLQDYLRRTFSNTNITVRARMKKTDSAEVYMGEEYIGIIHVDDEDGDRSFNFTMAILDVDLEG